MRKLLLLLFIGFYGISTGQNIDPYLLNGTWSRADSCATPTEYLVLNYKGYYTRYLVNCQGSPLHISSGECTYYPKSQSVGFINYYTYFNGKWTELLTGDTLGKDSIVILTENQLVIYSQAGNKEYLKIKKVPDNLAALYKPGAKRPERVDSLVVMKGFTVPKINLPVHKINRKKIKFIKTLNDIEVVINDSNILLGLTENSIKGKFLTHLGDTFWFRQDTVYNEIEGNDGINYSIRKIYSEKTPDSLRYVRIPVNSINYLLYTPKKNKLIGKLSVPFYYAGILYGLGIVGLSLIDNTGFSQQQIKHYTIASGLTTIGILGVILSRPRVYYIQK